MVLCPLVLVFVCMVSNGQGRAQSSDALWHYVNPFIGTANSGHVPFADPDAVTNFTSANTTPAAVMPWGMAAAAPRNTMSLQPWNNTFGKVASGYYYGEPYWYVFSQNAISGTGCHELGHILMMPLEGGLSTDIEERKTSYSQEKASPGYYKVYLDDYELELEATATTRSTLYRFISRESTDSLYITFDLFHNAKAADTSFIEIVGNNAVQGWVENGGFCSSPNKQRVHFYATFSQPFKSSGIWKDSKILLKSSASGKNIGAFARFSTPGNNPIITRIGISYVSIENAEENVKTEQVNQSFESVLDAAQSAWQQELGKVAVEGGTEEEKVIFYTALYHMLIHPSVYSDVNGDYVAPATKVVQKLPPNQKAQYTFFSLWDTYRNLYPFLCLVYPERMTDMLKSMEKYIDGRGVLPKWALTSDELHVMIGDPGAIVFTDAYLRGLHDFDTGKVLNAMLRSANDTSNVYGMRPGNAQFLKYGYIPDDNRGDQKEWTGHTAYKVWGSVATSLEYNMADFAISQFAGALGEKEIRDDFLQRSKGYQHFFDAETAFLRPKTEAGTFLPDFDPVTLFGEVPGATAWFCGGRGFCEGNAWQWNYFVPHDIPGLIDLMGEERFVERLQSAFENEDRFALHNEPDMAYPYLFNYVPGEEWRTQKNARAALKSNYTSEEGGIPGNDDAGTMSCWAVMTAIGLYTACPASVEYQISKPVFDKVTIELNGDFYEGSRFEILTKNAQSDQFISTLFLNGKKLNRFFITHEEIIKGGSLNLED